VAPVAHLLRQHLVLTRLLLLLMQLAVAEVLDKLHHPLDILLVQVDLVVVGKDGAQQARLVV
jgi:hypothetical protein